MSIMQKDGENIKGNLMKSWVCPTLSVIMRNMPEERALSSCKASVTDNGNAGINGYCDLPSGGCWPCYNYGSS